VAENNTPRLMDAAGECLLYDEIEQTTPKRRNLMLTWIIVILLILWLLGYFGPNVFSGFPRSGNAVHVLLVIVIILVILNLLKII
jgi:lipopolysaccharide export LptBFGC system permease protein LptF